MQKEKKVLEINKNIFKNKVIKVQLYMKLL